MALLDKLDEITKTVGDKVDEITKTVGDKVGGIAKSVSDKTGDMVEIGKLSGKIRNEEGNIAAMKAKLGEYFYQRFEAGELFADEAGELCAAIAAAYHNIEEARAEIERIKAKDEAEEDPLVCPACQHRAEEGMSFCPICGTTLNGAKTPEGVCPNCQKKLPGDAVYCPYCGAKVKE